MWKYAKFFLIFLIHAGFILFRRLPIVLLSQIRQEIKIHNDDIGFLVSCHAAALTVSKLVFGVAADRSSNLRIYTGGLLTCAALTLCLAFSTTILQITAIMILIGCMQGACWVPATKLLSQIFDDTQYSTMFSILGTASTVAGLFMPYLKLFYWRTILFNLALVLGSVAGFTRFFSRIPEESTKVVGAEKKSQGLAQVVKSSVIWHIAIIYLFSMEMRTISETWMPLYLAAEKQAGFQIFYEVGGLIGILASGVLLDSRILSRRTVGVCSTTVMMICGAMVLKYKEYSTPFGFLIGFFVNASINVWCLIAAQCGDKTVAGTCSAFISFIAASGSIFAGTPLSYLIKNFGGAQFVFQQLFILQTLFVLTLSVLQVPLTL